MDLQTVLNAMTHAGNKIFELFSFKILMAAQLLCHSGFCILDSECGLKKQTKTH